MIFNKINKDIRYYQFLDFLKDNNKILYNLSSKEYKEIFNEYKQGFYNFNKNFDKWFEENNVIKISEDIEYILENPIELEERFYKIENMKFPIKVFFKDGSHKIIEFSHILECSYKSHKKLYSINTHIWNTLTNIWAENYNKEFCNTLENSELLKDLIRISNKYGKFNFYIEGDEGIILYMKVSKKIYNKKFKKDYLYILKKYNKELLIANTLGHNI